MQTFAPYEPSAEAGYNTFVFDSTSKYVTVPSFNIPQGRSIVAWVKNGASASGQDRVLRMQSPELILTIESDGIVSAVYNNTVLRGSVNIRDDNWHLVSLDFDGSNISIWIDGQLDARDRPPVHLFLTPYLWAGIMLMMLTLQDL